MEMKPFYCASENVCRRVADAECGTLDGCPKDREKCEIRQKHVSARKAAAAEAEAAGQKSARQPDPPAGNPDPAPAKADRQSDSAAGGSDAVSGNISERRLVLDFDRPPELYDRLVEAADADLRSIEMEVMYLVKKVFERADIARTLGCSSAAGRTG
ncbi:MAG: hypothetical protein K9J79_03755 [Desulfobacteraceae bacterium]|nr:hypothetical protein [Desulfobacteraceae bacterium]